MPVTEAERRKRRERRAAEWEASLLEEGLLTPEEARRTARTAYGLVEPGESSRISDYELDRRHLSAAFRRSTLETYGSVRDGSASMPVPDGVAIGAKARKRGAL